MIEDISHKTLHDLAGSLMDGHIKYGFGAKAAFDAKPEKITSIDCSGFVRYFLFHVTRQQVKIPDGSWNQNEWCKNSKLEVVDYGTTAQIDDCLRLAYFPQKGKQGEPNFRAGHIWFVLNGKTLESHGGVGPNRRAWDTKVLKDNVTACYNIALVRKDTAAFAVCLDLDRLRNFFEICAWARVSAKHAQPRFRKADFGFLSPVSSAGYFEIELGDPIQVAYQTEAEQYAFIDRFLQKASANIPAALAYLEHLTAEARANLTTIQKMIEDARFSQNEFLTTVDSLSRWLVRTQMASEIALSVTSLFVPAAGWIHFGEKVAVTFATTWKQGGLATALAVGGVGVTKLSKMAAQEAIAGSLTHAGHTKLIPPARFAFKFLFVAKDLQDKIAVLADPRKAFDRY